MVVLTGSVSVVQAINNQYFTFHLSVVKIMRTFCSVSQPSVCVARERELCKDCTLQHISDSVQFWSVNDSLVSSQTSRLEPFLKVFCITVH